jgi:colanic acid biosynthesis glycosyl transferase WcaI
MPARGAFRRRHGFSDSDFLAVYSGNLGIKQGLDLLLEVAPLLQNSRIQIVLCGDGADRRRLEKMLASKKLSNVRMLPLQEKTAFQEMLTDADLCLVLQRSGTGRWFFPSKLLNILAYARPVLTVADADSELGRLVSEEQLGTNVEPGNPRSLADALEQMADAHEALASFGENGHRYVKRFEMERVLSNFEAVLDDVAAVRHNS